MKIALDPTPFHHSHALLEFPALAAELGYEHLQLTPHRDLFPFHRHPRADAALVAALKREVAAAGTTIASTLPVQRISSPDEVERAAAVRNFTRVLQVTVDLGVQVVGTEFSGRPERAEASDASFYRSMEDLLPIVEREGLTLLFDPHPDDFVEDAIEALRVLRGLDSPHVGFVYVASHTYHYGHPPAEVFAAAGDLLQLVHVADTHDHTRSHGLRYITNPPGSTARVHQHLKVGDGDVDWDAFFDGLAGLGFLGRPEAIACSSVFAEDEAAAEVSRYQLATITERSEAARARAAAPADAGRSSPHPPGLARRGVCS